MRKYTYDCLRENMALYDENFDSLMECFVDSLDHLYHLETEEELAYINKLITNELGRIIK